MFDFLLLSVIVIQNWKVITQHKTLISQGKHKNVSTPAEKLVEHPRTTE
jgi:hypothetical protein